MKKEPLVFLLFVLSVCCVKAQYVQPERNDTVYIFPKTVFDSTEAIKALTRGNSTIKGIIYLSYAKGGWIYGKEHLYANKIKILIFPVTPYLLEYLDLKEHKENPKKLRFVRVSKEFYHYHYEAITNSTGEFTVPYLKPGKYYLEAMMSWNQSGSYDKYAGHANDGYGDINFYQKQNYTNYYNTKLSQIVEIKTNDETLDVKLSKSTGKAAKE